MAGNTCIFRLTNTGQNESSVSDKIEFDGNAATPDALSHFRYAEWRMSRSIQENPRPQSNNPHDLQDLGLSQMEVVCYLFVEDPRNAKAITFLRNWSREDVASKGNVSAFPYGRFGLRADDFPQFNVTPSSTAGYMLADVNFARVPQVLFEANMTVTLRFNGDITKLGV